MIKQAKACIRVILENWVLSSIEFNWVSLEDMGNVNQWFIDWFVHELKNQGLEVIEEN
jgi:hypothetical protein